jgi:hypothetical protein
VDSETITSLTGSDITYNYRELPECCSDDEIAAYIQRTRELFSPIARAFDNERNTEWFIRSYLALKFVLGATVLANSAEYAEGRNLQVTLPYLSYYTILNCCRSFLLTLPCLDWRGENTRPKVLQKPRVARVTWSSANRATKKPNMTTRVMISAGIFPLNRLAAVAATDSRTSAAYPHPDIVLGARFHGSGGTVNGDSVIRTPSPF